MFGASEIDLSDGEVTDALVKPPWHHRDFGKSHDAPVCENTLRGARLVRGATTARSTALPASRCDGAGLGRLDFDVVGECNCALDE